MDAYVRFLDETFQHLDKRRVLRQKAIEEQVRTAFDCSPRREKTDP